MNDLCDVDLVRNATLLRELDRYFDANEYGNISNFFATPDNWRCPCCFRNKREIARLDKNGNLLCAFVMHHDHYGDGASLAMSGRDLTLRTAVESCFSRFSPTLICNDCNVVDSAAKRLVGAPERFSFTPFEIASFTDVHANKPHGLIEDRVRTTYEHSKAYMILKSDRLRALKNNDSSRGFEHITGANARVLASLLPSVLTTTKKD